MAGLFDFLDGTFLDFRSEEEKRANDYKLPVVNQSQSLIQRYQGGGNPNWKSINATPIATNMSFPIENAQPFDDQIVTDVNLAPLDSDVQNMSTKGSFDAMDMMGMNTTQGPATETQSQINPPTEEPGFFDKIGSGMSDFFGDEERMARMTIALNSMRLNPDPNIAKSMENKLESLRKGKGKNATVIQLRTMGRNDLADAVESGSMKATTAWTIAFREKGKPTARDQNIALYESDPNKFRELKEEGVIGGSGTTVNVGGQEMTPGWKKIDQTFADDYMKWTGGGGADTAGNIAKLEDVLGKLESGEKLTGPIIGQLPDFIMAFLDPDAVGSREAVEGVVQRNLKAILGAQFTEKEGEKLIKRAYNPTLPGPENARRLRVLVKQMTSALQSKNQMTEYFRKNGTLMGYDGRIPQINDFWAALEGLKIGQKVGNKIYLGGDPKLESSYK
jgi:hypothetical protein